MSSGLHPHNSADAPPDSAEGWLALFESDRLTPDLLEEFESWCQENTLERQRLDRLRELWHRAEAAQSDPLVVSNLQRPRTARNTILAAATILIAFGAFWLRPTKPSPSTFALSTLKGEQLSHDLADGSTVLLNTDTELDVGPLNGAAGREVWLRHGEVMFDVAHASERPFLVHSNGWQITVVGTRFAVRYDPGSQCPGIGVLEGVVKVAHPSFQGAVQVSAGQALPCAGTTDLVRGGVFLESVSAWSSGRIRFDNRPLIDALREINRYSDEPWDLGDGSLEELRISGSFLIESVRNPSALAPALEESLQLEHQRVDGRHLLYASTD